MGEPIKIKDLAEQIILFSGLEVGKDIEIKYTKPRPGERLTEPLWDEEESPEPTAFPKILKLKKTSDIGFNLAELLESLRPICFGGNNYRNADALKKILCEAIPSLKEFYEQNGKVA